MRLPVCLALAALMMPVAAVAADYPPEDKVSLSLSAEDWVKTDSARVVVAVEAAVNGASSGNARSEMMEAVGDVAHADWRLTNFSRAQDQTGMERWSASFEARLPENKLSGLADSAKKHSKAGMQLSIAQIDFSPTQAEMQAGYGNLRVKLYKEAKEQLAAIDQSFPDKGFRISQIDFTDGRRAADMMPRMARGNMMMAKAAPMMPEDASMERAEKIVETAQIVFAASVAKEPATKP
jgi:hypothetical protein